MAKKDVQDVVSHGIFPDIGRTRYSRAEKHELWEQRKNFEDSGAYYNYSDEQLILLFTTSVEGLEDSEEIKSELTDIFSEPENMKSLRQMIKENSTDIEHLLHGFRKLGKVLKLERKIKQYQKQIDEIKLKQYVKGSNLSKASQFIISKVHKLECEIKKAESEKEKLLQTKEVVAAYEFHKIATYSHLLNEGKLVYTPSVLAQKQELCDKVTSGQSVLLSGPVGTGKTRMAKDLYLNILQEKLNAGKITEEEYEMLKPIPIINGNEETSFRELKSKPVQMSNKTDTDQAFTYEMGLLTKCLKYNLPLIIDEANRTPANFLSSLKTYRGSAKGQYYKDEITGESFELQGPLQVILTANEGAKYAAHTQKFQDQIKREITREYIGYFPENEMYDMLKAKLYTEPGIAYVQREDLEHTLPNLISAVSQVNELYLKGGDYSLKDGSTSSVKIKGTVFDTKRFLELVDRSKIGTENTFLEELNKNIVHFIANEVDDDTDRKILCQIFGAKGLIWKENIPEILSGNTQLQQSDLSSSLASTKHQAINSIYGQNKNGERFLNPRELATGYGTLGVEHRLAHFDELDRDDNGTKIKAFKKSINQLFNPIKDREIISMMNKLDEHNLDDFINKVVESFLNDGNKKNLNEFSAALRELSPEKYNELDKELQKLGYNLHPTQKSAKNPAPKTANKTPNAITESIDTPADVLEFRRGFVDGVKKNNDVTQEKLEKIVEIGEKLVREPKEGKSFHFEETAYGEMGVLKLGGKTMKFLNIAHPQDFNDQLTHKIKDESLNKYDYKAEYYCRCDNTQDLVLNKAMPGGSEEDAGIVEFLGKVEKSTGLRQLTRAEMEDTVRGILKSYCNQNRVGFSDEDDYMLLYMYLMGPKGGYGWQWLSNLQNASRPCFACAGRRRGFGSDGYGNSFASFFLGLLV